MFYTLEGIDGAGCGAVRRELEKILQEKKIVFKSLKYPAPNLPFADEIYGYLDSKFTLPAEALFLALAGQMAIEKGRIKEYRREVLIIDRYLPCTLVFQGAKGFPIEKGMEIANTLSLEKPDRIFYLKLPWKVAYERKQAEQRESDANERDITLFEKTEKLYNKIATKQVLAPWVEIDATMTPEQEAWAIFKIIEEDLKNA